MRLDIPVTDVIPLAGAVLKRQGVPEGVDPDSRLLRLAQHAINICRDLSRPSAILADISPDEFETVYHGEGMNEETTPLKEIYRSSHRLALFAVTVGQPVCDEISRLFDEGEYALASMLDAAASESAEVAAQAAQDDYERRLREDGRLDVAAAVMRFSPGYCGWDVSGQRKLFAYLSPEEIGIELSDSFLMRPLKSVSGVMVVGPHDIFDIDDSYPFCGVCDTHECRDRFQAADNKEHRLKNQGE
jgi:hypothetical protein